MPSTPTHPSQLDHAALAHAILRRKPVLRDKLIRACDVNADDAELLLTEVIRFVNLAAYSGAAEGQALTPSQTVDDGWHELILCTREYGRLCSEQFGRFIHHDPGGDAPLNRERFRHTLGLYALCFGTPDPRWWGPGARAMVSADCGPCQSSAPTPDHE